MKNKQWLLLLLIFQVIILVLIIIFNYIVDPYNIFNSKLVKLEKIKESEKIRLVKTIKVNEIAPKSIVLGTSRAEFAYNPNHSYFIQPSYNFAIPSGSMYENLLNFKWALKQGNLEQVLLVTDYIMFNDTNQSAVSDFENYFNSNTNIKYLLSIDTLKDSVITLLQLDSSSAVYLSNGQRDPFYYNKNITSQFGHFNYTKKLEKNFYKLFSSNNTYKDTGKSSFNDFEELLILCAKNNIKLDVVFGPNHIRLWETFSYRFGFEHWLRWKSDVFSIVNKYMEKNSNNNFRIFDFSIYNKFTSEKFKDRKMLYHWEANHYKDKLGELVLNNLIKNSNIELGVELNNSNIIEHLNNLRNQRLNHINSNEYLREVYAETK